MKRSPSYMNSQRLVKRNKPQRKASILRQPTFKKQAFQTLVYTEAVKITSTVTGVGGYQFSCNGLYDPNTFGGGTQPLYFDQLMALYNHYTVISSKMTVTFSDAVNRQSTCTLYIDDDTGASTDGVVAASRPGAVTRSGYLAQIGAFTLTKNWSARATFGGNPQSKAELTGNVSNNPSEQSFFTLATKDHNITQNDYNVMVKIEYLTVFDEWKTVAAS